LKYVATGLEHFECENKCQAGASCGHIQAELNQNFMKRHFCLENHVLS